MSTVDSIDKTNMMITTKIIKVEPDKFFDNPFDFEVSLITRMKEACKLQGNVEEVFQGRTVPEGCSKCEHYSKLTRVAYNLADVCIYRNTNRFRAGYLIMSADLLPVFIFTQDFKPEPLPKMHGMYVAGSYNDIPVLISPVLDKGEMLWGVNEDHASSVLTFINDEDHICSKIVDSTSLLLMKLKD